MSVIVKQIYLVKYRTYSQVKLGVLKNLCSDILLGGDFQSQHRKVIFEYDSKGSDFIVKNRENNACAVAAAFTKPSTLFDNLHPDCRPIATKSQRFNSQHREFMKDEVDKLSSAGIIRPSRSPWRAQVLVVTNSESGKKRMCVDYS